jgi:hypothetical protein
MVGFTKLFSSIVHSTVWREKDHVRLVWITMLALADKNGNVEASIPGLADAARVTIKECEDALERFQKPDKYSRSVEHEGRRVKPVDGGWLLLNYEKYRGKLVAEKKREQNAERQRRFREKQNNAPVTPGNVTVTRNAQSEAESEAEAYTEEKKKIDGTKAPSKAKKVKRKPRETKSGPVWDMYASAYKQRYGTEPVRNAKSNSLCCQLVDRLSASEAPLVAKWYVGSDNSWYMQQGHSLAALVKDCEKLRTEWATKRRITTTFARKQDRQSEQGEMYSRVIDDIREGKL